MTAKPLCGSLMPARALAVSCSRISELETAAILGSEKPEKPEKRETKGMNITEEITNLIDVFMPEDLCARCAEKEPKLSISLLITPSPSSTFTPTRLSFCSKYCLEQFVVGWKGARGMESA